MKFTKKTIRINKFSKFAESIYRNQLYFYTCTMNGPKQN